MELEKKLVAEEILERDRKHLSRALYPRPGIAMKRAFEEYIEDVDGKRYLDFTAGASTSVGYMHPRIIEAAITQLRKGVDHTQSDLSMGVVELRSELAEEVKSHAPSQLSSRKIVFGHSGSDIIERAIRLVRFTTKRPMIVSYFEAHHGASAAALSASPNLKDMGSNWVSRFFQLPGFIFMPFPDSYRPWFGEGAEAGAASLAFLERLLSCVISPSMVAGVIVEPILSLGNVVPPDGYFEALAEICKRNQIPLIADEVMTGIGKTGRMFAMEHWNVWSDVICLGKGLSCSFPFAMLLAEYELAEKWESKDYASMSKDGDILGCAVALETLRVVREEKLVERAEKAGSYLMNRLEDLKQDCKLLGQVRGLGLMVGFDIVESETTKVENSALAKKIFDGALKHGLILGLRGSKGNVLEFLPALTIDNSQIDSAIEILEQVSKEVR
jgi:4-aminobutyrate aminotransferase